MTAALEGGEWSVARPSRTFPLWKTLYQFYRSLGGPQGRSGRAENLAPPGFDGIYVVEFKHQALKLPSEKEKTFHANS
jgi:hypothetical protein